MSTGGEFTENDPHSWSVSNTAKLCRRCTISWC